MSPKLPKFEIYLYFATWILSLAFAFYKVYSDGNSLSSNSLKNHFFENGWTILNRKKDISDDEWETWTEFLFKLIPWMLIHLSTSELLRSTYIEALPLCYVLTTMGVLMSFFPIVVPAFFIFQLTIFFLAMLSASRLIIWTLGVFFLLFMNIGVKYVLSNQIMEEGRMNLIFVSNGWFYIRCLDFILSNFDETKPTSQIFLDYLSYVFYLPSFFLGPFIPYEHFKFQVNVPRDNLVKKRFTTLLYSLCLYIFYYLVYELSLHYFYCNAMHYEIEAFVPSGMWTVSGVGICLANFFYLKYLFIYGIASTFAKAENYKMPPNPKCIYRIHLYSRMWRYFDRGFYLFMFRCIYSPICETRGASIKRRMLASLLCFIFIYIWHGGSTSVLYWSVFNYVGLISEALSKYFWKINSTSKYSVVSKLTKTNVRRLEALGASPLWLLAVVSNFMFFGGHEMGLLFVKTFLQGPLLFHIAVSIIAYAMCQTSIEIENLYNSKYSR